MTRNRHSASYSGPDGEDSPSDTHAPYEMPERPPSDDGAGRRSPSGGARAAESSDDVNPPLPNAKQSASDAGDSLARMNRHWYRRCLDILNGALRDAGTNPSIDRLRSLSDGIVTSFLTAVTGQAPDSERCQFPADRAYFIPFEGDQSAKFNFAKPYYQTLNAPKAYLDEADVRHSLWSFLPWSTPAVDVRIHPEGSVDRSTFQTMSFDEMIASGVQSLSEEAERNESVLTLRKSLLLRDAEDESLRDTFRSRDRESREDSEQEPGRFDSRTSEISADDEAIEFLSLPRKIRQGVHDVFGIYRKVPGNPSIELLLLNHLHMLRWLASRRGIWNDWLGSLVENFPVEETELDGLTFQQSEYHRLFAGLVRTIFLGVDSGQSLGRGPAARSESVAFEEKLLRIVLVWLDARFAEPFRSGTGVSAPGFDVSMQKAEGRSRETSTATMAMLLLFGKPRGSTEKFNFRFRDDRIDPKKQIDTNEEPSRNSASDADSATDERHVEEQVTTANQELARLKCDVEIDADNLLPPGLFSIVLEEAIRTLERLKSDLRSFLRFFLVASKESSLEGDLRTVREDDPRRAGETRSSFVWVCPDFGDPRRSVTDFSGLPVKEDELAVIGDQLETINEAYQAFFRHHETTLQDPFWQKIGNYWRKRGTPTRERRIHTSFEADSQLFGKVPVPEDDPLAAALKKPKPRSIFLRVRICDSLNEPFVNGLFVFTTDHDEVELRNRTPEALIEDVEDLLSFAKVFFFIVRDHIHSLDRARDASDVGRLNQHLFDSRLADLDRRMRNRSDRDVTSRKNWSPFTYEVLNNYAASLIEKPDEVRTEVFPFDRLLIVPIPEPRRTAEQKSSTASSHGTPLKETRAASKVDPSQREYELPVSLFQAIYTESEDGKVCGGHFSLVKPFQSPIEKMDAADGNATERFGARTFQKVSDSDGRTVPVDRYLEKHYVGAVLHPDDAAGREVPPDSYVVKASSDDTGRTWATNAIRAFWKTCFAPQAPVRSPSEGASDGGSRNADERWQTGIDLWIPFLCRLTEEWRSFGVKERSDEETSADQSWFLLRFSLLTAVLNEVPEGDAAFQRIRDRYELELKLRFDHDRKLHVLEMARSEGDALVDPFAELMKWNKKNSVANDPLKVLNFASVMLRDQDPWLLAFLKCLTSQVRGQGIRSAGTASGSMRMTSEGTSYVPGAEPVYFQPLLTRPFEESTRSRAPGDKDASKVDVTSRLTLQRSVQNSLGRRVPDYDKVLDGEEAFPMFLGVVNIEVGRTEVESRRLRCVVMLLRDFDHTRTDAGQTDEESVQQMKVDRNDLTLYSRTYFQNVERFLRTAREQQQVRVLSTDITQIARNWYSTGVDAVERNVREALLRLMQDSAEDPDLTHLRPEVLQSFFEGILDVLRREEKRRKRETIDLESFPFDRLLHIPLYGPDVSGAILSYARTAPDADLKAGSAAATDGYQEIRRQGRHAVLGKGRKKVVKESLRHLAPSDVASAGLAGLRSALESIAANGLREGELVSQFIRRLYHGRPLQTLAIAGLCCHALAGFEKGTGEKEKSSPALGQLSVRLRAVLRDTLLAVERTSDGRAARGDDDHLRNSAIGEIATDVHMDRDVRISPLEAAGASDGKGVDLSAERAAQQGQNPLADTASVPFFHELFADLEPGSASWRYGLQPEGKSRETQKRTSSIRSKVFYVYYSIASPEEFLDKLEFGDRYRGIFCLIVDDASTDDKRETSTTAAAGAASTDDFSAAEEADQEDIRTFIHNATGRLKLVLDNQSLTGRLHRPGVEQFVTGMFHRLKNDLAHPKIAFDVLEEAVKAPERVQANQGELIQRIAGARAMLKGVDGLFNDLKGVEEDRRLGVALHRLSSDWVGWQFVRSLTVAMLKAIPETAGNEPVRSEVNEVAGIARTTLEGMQSHESETKRPDTARIQRSLVRLESAMKRYWAASGQPHADAQFEFTYVVFSTDQLFVLGSRHHLGEALNIYSENAFEATLKFLKAKTDPFPAGAPRTARVAMVCRRCDVQPDEIRIEIENLGQVDDETLAVLNSPTPRPFTKRQYENSSGKRKDGSGFGSYHARRTIQELCGARKKRRLLDATTTNLASEKSVRLSIQLLEATLPETRIVTAKEILHSTLQILQQSSRASEESLRRLADRLTTTRADARFLIPEDSHPLKIVETSLRMLENDRRRRFERIASQARDACRVLKTQTHRFVQKLRSGFESASGSPETPHKLSDVRVRLFSEDHCRRGSFHDLKAILEERFEERREHWKTIVDGNEALRAAFGPFLATGRLEPDHLIPENETAEFGAVVEAHRPGLTPEAAAIGWRLLLKDVGKDVKGSPTPNVEVLAGSVRPEIWDFRVTDAEDGLRLTFFLGDAGAEGVPDDFDALERFQTPGDVKVLAEFSTTHSRDASSFAGYRNSLRDCHGPKTVGDLRLDRIAGIGHRGAIFPEHVVGRTVHLVFPAAMDVESPPLPN